MQVMQVSITSELKFLKNFKKLTQKTRFVVSFQRFLDAPIFGQMKGLMEIHNAGKFH